MLHYIWYLETITTNDVKRFWMEAKYGGQAASVIYN